MIRLEVIFSQLIFDHAMRVRVNTASVGGAKKTATASASSSSGSSAKSEPLKSGASPSKELSSQAGIISNLLTEDVTNLKNAGDFSCRTFCRSLW